MIKRIRCRDNRTKKYLFPILNSFGKTFLNELNNLTNYATGYPPSHSIIEAGITDILYIRSKRISIDKLSNYPYLFLVFDTNGILNEDKGYLNTKEGKRRFSLFLSYIRNSKHYIFDYWYKKDNHCIVFNTEEFSNAFKAFLVSEYSKMYNDEEFSKLKIPKFQQIGDKKYNISEYAVLKKQDDVGHIVLKKSIYENFGVDYSPENPNEFDIPWFVEEEVLNSKYMSPQTLEEFKKIKYVKTNE